MSVLVATLQISLLILLHACSVERDSGSGLTDDAMQVNIYSTCAIALVSLYNKAFRDMVVSPSHGDHTVKAIHSACVPSVRIISGKKK